ncbi:MAG: hypothetical protein ACYC3L_07480 [Gemmatimonadaceae bacterium]
MIPQHFLRRTLLIVALAAPMAASAQGAPAPVTKLDFSGLLFGGFSYKTNAGAQNANKFDLERAYLTFKMPVAEHVSIRVTADIASQQSGVGYVLRAKYAFAQYDRPATAGGYSGFVRAGVLQTVAIEHMEAFWPRWMGTVPVERFGYFSSADVGVAGQLTFPHKQGELYAAVTNGNGYSNPETDRFKSYAARLTLTPLADGKHGLLTTFAVSPWIEFNGAASKFVNGGAGQVGLVGEGLQRNRFGVFAGIRDPNLVIGANYSQRVDGVESGANTAASPRTATDVTGRLLSAFTVIRPFQLADGASKSPLSLLVRYDHVLPNTSLSAQGSHLFESSVILDLAHSRRTQLAFDFQETLGKAPVASVAANKMFQIRMVANF